LSIFAKKKQGDKNEKAAQNRAAKSTVKKADLT
jgi:hypothetical protein